MKTPQLPIPKLSAALGFPGEIWLKREDLHHYGSHKGRSLPPMITEYAQQGIKDFVISSSGNAALAGALFIAAHNQNKPNDPCTLKILVGENIDADKLKKIKKAIGNDSRITVAQNKKPKQTAWQTGQSGSAKLLRQSTDDLALTGYEELAGELSKIPNLAAVFIPTSSGTTAQGLHEGFQKLGLNPQIHIAQTTACHPMIREKVKGEGSKENSPFPLSLSPSLATAIVDKVAHRKDKVLEAIKNSRGSGWIINNEEIVIAIKTIKETANLDISPNSALAVAAATAAIKSGARWDGPIVCLITGA